MKLFSYIFAFLILSLSTVSCVDEKFYDPEDVGEGLASVTAEICFDNLTPALSRAVSGGSSGTAINSMTDICVLLYPVGSDSSTAPLKYYFHNVATEISDQEKPALPDSEKEHWAQTSETSVVKASLRLYDVPYGNYRMYAIANVPEEVFTDEVISDINNVKSLRFKWNDTDIPANNQMFGYFSTDDSYSGFEAPVVTLNNSGVSLRAWVKRLASKVTVAFDARNLKDDIDIYLINATVKDIPAYCFLGKENKPGSYMPSDNEMNRLIATGQSLQFVDDPEEIPYDENWPARISNKSPIYGMNPTAINGNTETIDQQIAAQHGENVSALYFYENMQGEGTAGTASDKWQVVEGDYSTIPTFPDGNTPPDGTEEHEPEKTGFKDAKIYGSYLEVQAYYISKNQNEPSRGYITYRFMLGKDTHTDFNAERNHHFKVTLCFKGYANDVDWHIAYDQSPKIIGPTPCYISYLYNQSMEYSFNVVGGKLKKLTAQIPVNGVTKRSWHPMEGQVKPDDPDVYYDGDTNDPGPWNGFLSLRKTTEAEYGTVTEGYGSGNAATYTLNKVKFYGSSNYDPTNNNVYNLGYREYDVTEGTHEEEAGTYSINEVANGVWSIKIPLFTRPRVMVSQTGYTGNNPYIAYNRLSQVEFKATVERKGRPDTVVSKVIDVTQARRIVNPKAVWRKAGSVRPFHVQLKIMEAQNSSTFTNLLSNGPWKVVVEKGADWIDLVPTEGASKKNPDGSISGIGYQYDSENETGRTVDFTIQPKSVTTEPRGGIVKVYYDSYCCVHSIFVRQGYDPVEFYSSGTLWHTSNLLTGGDDEIDATETEVPEMEGSYFREFNREFPIDASSNTAPRPFKVVNGIDKYFKIAGTNEYRKWEKITLSPMPKSWGTFKVKNIVSRIPSKEDWETIINNTNTVYGFGILYGDEATETKEPITEAYGAGKDTYSQGYGMRGVIICDETSGTQMFLPVAASGYGRFKQKCLDGYELRLPKNWGGVVQYANRYALFTQNWGKGVMYKPLFYNLYSTNGTIYWLADGYALDINYFNLGFSIDDQNGLGVVWSSSPDPSGTDALHLRLVHDR